MEIVDHDLTKKMVKLQVFIYHLLSVWKTENSAFTKNLTSKYRNLCISTEPDTQCNLFVNGDVDVFQTILDLCDTDGIKFKLVSLNLLDCLLGIKC